MPIDLTCTCGRALVLRDELAGKVIRCPECQAELAVPAATAIRTAPEPVLDVLPAGPAAEPTAVQAAAPPPPSPRRMNPRDGNFTPPPSGARSGSGFGSINAGVGGGLLMMVVAVIWFVVGLLAIDRIFIYPPILFIIGLVAFFRGLAGGGNNS
jgi:hypothetical protein